jgi:hypothetical protein
VHVYDDIQDLVEELIVIENIMRQQRVVLESSPALRLMTAKSFDAFSLQISHKDLENSQAQLRQVTELLLMAQDKKNLVSLRVLFPVFYY